MKPEKKNALDRWRDWWNHFSPDQQRSIGLHRRLTQERQDEELRALNQSAMRRLLTPSHCTPRLLVVQTEFIKAGAVWIGNTCAHASRSLRWMRNTPREQVKINLLKMQAKWVWRDMKPHVINRLRSPSYTRLQPSSLKRDLQSVGPKEDQRSHSQCFELRPSAPSFSSAQPTSVPATAA